MREGKKREEKMGRGKDEKGPDCLFSHFIPPALFLSSLSASPAQPPFYSRHVDEMYDRILCDTLRFPEHIPAPIRLFLQVKKKRRWGREGKEREGEGSKRSGKGTRIKLDNEFGLVFIFFLREREGKENSKMKRKGRKGDKKARERKKTIRGRESLLSFYYFLILLFFPF